MREEFVMEKLTEAQRRAVRWYIGDTTGDDPFWDDPKAYVTLNALFFHGIGTEQARAAEGKRLNPSILADGKRLFAVLHNLAAAFRPLEDPVCTYRVERYADYLTMRERGTCISFTSTSTVGFLDAYRDRTGIALMQFVLPVGTPCIPMAKLLADYAKADEAEILLPPSLPLCIEEMPLTQDMLAITDADGNPPVTAVKAVPARLPQRCGTCPSDDDGRLAGIRVLTALQSGETPDAEDVKAYSHWKAQISWEGICDETIC